MQSQAGITALKSDSQTQLLLIMYPIIFIFSFFSSNPESQYPCDLKSSWFRPYPHNKKVLIFDVYHQRPKSHYPFKYGIKKFAKDNEYEADKDNPEITTAGFTE